MKNFLHIGLGKAASTTLQRVVFNKLDNNIEFVGRTGVERTDRNIAISSVTHLNSFLYNEEENLKSLNLDNSKRLLISDENLSTFRRTDPYIMANRMKKILGDSKVLLITREPIDWLNSLYFFRLERAEDDAYQNHNEWLRSSLRTKSIGSPLLQVHYAKIYEIYANVFGKENITILPFEMLKYDVKKFYNTIEKFLEIEDGSIKYEEIKDRVFKKRFTAEHYKMIEPLFDIEKNKKKINKLFEKHFSKDIIKEINSAKNIKAYRLLAVKNILKIDIENGTKAKVVFEEHLIKQVYNYNQTVDEMIEDNYKVKLSDFGYKSF